MLIDAHCHLDYFSDEEIEKAIDDVDLVISNGVNRETNKKNLEITKSHPKVKLALGIYPIEALKISRKELEEEIELIRKNKNKIIAVGEVGMDFKENDDKGKQIEIFKEFIDLSLEIEKPLVIHSRKAEKECIEVLEEMNAKRVLMHCFCGNMKLVERIVRNGWKMSIPANVKFSTQFQDTVRKVPIDNLLCETDSPYLHPEKDFPNTPNNVIESYKKIAEIKKMDLKEVKKIIEKNYLELFG